LLKGVVSGFLCSLDQRGIRKAPVDALRVVGENRADLTHAITHRHHGVKVLASEEINMFGYGPAHVDPDSLHDSPGQWMNLSGRLAACAGCLYLSLAHLPQERLRHLGTRTILRAEKEHTQFGMGHGLRSSKSRIRQSDGRMKLQGGSLIERLNVCQIQAVVTGSFVGAAASFRHKPAFAQLAEMVGDQILGKREQVP
jgi:hypothetical protein